MNVTKDIFENKWDQIRARSQGWWGLFSNDDLEKVAKAPIKRDKYAMMLRVKYGYTNERARQEINERLTALEVDPPSDEFMREQKALQSMPKVPKVRARRTRNSTL